MKAFSFLTLLAGIVAPLRSVGALPKGEGHGVAARRTDLDERPCRIVVPDEGTEMLDPCVGIGIGREANRFDSIAQELRSPAARDTDIDRFPFVRERDGNR